MNCGKWESSGLGIRDKDAFTAESSGKKRVLTTDYCSLLTNHFFTVSMYDFLFEKIIHGDGF